jgi:hypothetical protein
MAEIDWTDLAQGRDKWRVLVNTKMNLNSVECWEFPE